MGLPPAHHPRDARASDRSARSSLYLPFLIGVLLAARDALPGDGAVHLAVFIGAVRDDVPPDGVRARDPLECERPGSAVPIECLGLHTEPRELCVAPVHPAMPRPLLSEFQHVVAPDDAAEHDALLLDAGRRLAAVQALSLSHGSPLPVRRHQQHAERGPWPRASWPP